MNLKKKIPVGMLDRRITVIQDTKATDIFGQKVKNSDSSFEAWAKVVYKGGDEKSEADQTSSFTRTDFTVRYNSNTKSITANQVIVHDQKRYEVKAIGEVAESRNRYLVIRTELIA